VGENKMAQQPTFQPVLEIRRGSLVDSIHLGAIAIATVNNYLAYSYGDSEFTAFMGAAANPLKLVPFVESGGMETFGLTDRELAIMCSSHDGSDEQIEILRSLQQKTSVQESDLLCGVQPPKHKYSEKTLWTKGEAPTPNRHPCSGEHTAMLAMANLLREPKEKYLDIQHPVQQLILKTIREMGTIRPEDIVIGIDDCSVPTFGITLYKAATCYARLIDPRGLYEKRAEACSRISKAMRDNPILVSGVGNFESTVMEVTNGVLFVKSGENGYFGMAILPGALNRTSPALGIAFKILDGDPRGILWEGGEEVEGLCTPPVAIEILKQLGAFSPNQIEQMARYSGKKLFNCQNLEIGSSTTVFKLNKFI
jgi:L-asparaginase II